MKRLIYIFTVLLPLAASAQSAYPGLHEEKFCHAHHDVALQAEPFDLHNVRLLKSRFRENMERDSAWMVSLSADRLLHSFRTTAGIWAGLEGGYTAVKKLGGWESLDCELRGHTTGHYLSACALMYAATGEELFRMKGDSLVSGLAAVQRAHGNGYLSAYPEELINRNLRGERVWAPWYTLHKLTAGLLDQYLYADNKEALEVVRGMGSWAYERLHRLDDATRARMLRNEFGGIPECWWNLYAITGDERFRFLGEFFYHNAVIDPLKQNDRTTFGTKHTNTFIPKVLAEARRYEVMGDAASKELSHFFFEAMLDEHTFATGSLSDKEHFFDPKHFSKHLSGVTGEACCTYNMLKLARHLFAWSGDVRIADYYEQALYNHILGGQDPATGMISYFLPLASGTHKVYSTPEHSFWCCVGSNFESQAKYGESIYYHHNNELFVNLFIPSELDWEQQHMRVRLESDFPHSEVVRLTLTTQAPHRATIRLRYPAWSGKAEVRINGRRIAVQQEAGSYIALDRTWRDGDRIEVRYPMSLHLATTPDDPSRAAVMYGPIVLAARCGTEGMVAPAPYSDPTKHNDYYTYNYHIPTTLDDTLSLDPTHLDQSLQREGDGLRFRTADGLLLEPLYDIHRERYIVYWHLKPASNPTIDN